MHPTDRQQINHVSLHIALVTVRHTVAIIRHPTYVLVGLEPTPYRGNYLTIIGVVINCNQVYVDNPALLSCIMHACTPFKFLTNDHALWSERFNKLQLTRVSD